MNIYLQQLASLLNPLASGSVAETLSEDDAFELIKVANQHFLTFALYASLHDKNVLPSFDHLSQAYLLELYEGNKARNQNILSTLAFSVGVLNQAGIEPLVFKGGACLVNNWYGDLGARFMTDIDLMVGYEAIESAYLALNKVGFKLKGHVQIDPLSFTNHDHQIAPLIRDGDAFSIELHKKLLARTCYFNVPVEVLLDQSELVSLGQAKVRVLKPLYEALINVLHCEISHGHHDVYAFDLRHGLDFLVLLHTYPDEINLVVLQRLLVEQGFSDVLPCYLMKLDYLFNLSGLQAIKGFDYKTPKAIKHLAVAKRLLRHDSHGLGLHIKWVSVKRYLKVGFAKPYIQDRYHVQSSAAVNVFRVVECIRVVIKYLNPRAWQAMWDKFSAQRHSHRTHDHD